MGGREEWELGELGELRELREPGGMETQSTQRAQRTPRTGNYRGNKKIKATFSVAFIGNYGMI